jgi:hypothetical protein
MTIHRGSCLCGDVTYEIEGPLERASHCHCSYCRKFHGTSFATYAIAPAAGLRWLRGEGGIARYESSPGFHRCFCARCGSPVPGDPFERWAFIPLGNLDGDPGVRPSFHIFAASKPPWSQIRDGLPAFDAYPPGIDAPVAPDLPPRDPAGAPRGSCLCGAIAFRVERPPILARSCHCGRCRKARGAAHASNVLVAIDGLRFTRGEIGLASYKIPEAQFFTQVFCPTCGAKQPRVDVGRGFAIAPLGAFDDDPGVRVREHIFVGSKAPWDEITDDLPRFDGPTPHTAR